MSDIVTPFYRVKVSDIALDIVKMQLMNEQTYDILCDMGNQRAKGGNPSFLFGGYERPPDERK